MSLRIIRDGNLPLEGRGEQDRPADAPLPKSAPPPLADFDLPSRGRLEVAPPPPPCSARSPSPAPQGRICRAAIVAEVRSWIGTPYRHQASLKGVASDCLGLVRGVWRAFYGAEPEPMVAYTPDWAEASGAETFAETAARHLTAVDVDAAKGGDVILFRWRHNLPAKHAAILIAADRMVHAQQGAVVATAALTPWWWRRTAFAFSFPGVTD